MSKVIISKRSKYGYDIFDIDGEISYDESQIIEDFVKNNSTGEFPNIILNLAGVSFINSSALSLFVKLLKYLHHKKINMYIMNPNETIQGLFKITGSDNHFKIIRNEDALTDNIKFKELDNLLGDEE